MKGFGHEVAHQGETNIWLTPPEVLQDLGPFDLDPCAAPEPRPWATAARHYDITKDEDGLYLPWEGVVWCNPPYGPNTGQWLGLMAHHQCGVAFTFARTETQYFFDHAWARGAGFLFLKGRVTFYRPDGSRGGTAPAPSVLIGYGDEGLRRLARSKLGGHLVVNAAAILVRADGVPVGTWREALDTAMAGRELRLRDIYAAAEGTAKVREAKSRGHNWQAQIRRALQVYFRPVAPAVWSAA
jgi:hypothetical protein